MAENEIRIKDLPSTQQINETDDVIVLDNATDGTRKLQGKVLLDMIHSAMAKGTASGAVATFTDGSDGIPMTDLVVSIEPQQSGSGDPSPENVRPISGWTACNVVRSGANLIGLGTQLNGYTNNSLYFVADANSTGYYFETAKLPDTITFNCTNGNRAYYAYYDSVPAQNVDAKVADKETQALPRTITIDKSYKYIHIQMSYDRATTNDQVCVGDTLQPYEPYNMDSHTYTINFVDGSSPLTVYGCTLNVLSGVLTVDRGQYTIDENQQNITIQSSESYGTVFRMVTGQSCIQNNTQISNRFKFDNNAWQINSNRIGTFVLGSEGNLYVQAPPSVGTTVDAFRTWLTSHNIQINYELATPQTYQLTPTQVKSLLGVNNIWADTGNVLNAEYVRDTTTIINQILEEMPTVKYVTQQQYDALPDSKLTDGVIYFVS